MIRHAEPWRTANFRIIDLHAPGNAGAATTLLTGQTRSHAGRISTPISQNGRLILSPERAQRPEHPARDTPLTCYPHPRAMTQPTRTRSARAR